MLQKSQSDCGVACLGSIIRYHGGNANQEKIRIMSGTSKQGTTMLGLYQTAIHLGFEADGLQADPEYLKIIQQPVILHALVNQSMQHYIVCYKAVDNHFLIGDPAEGIRWINGKELDEYWQSRKLLQLIPDAKKFIKTGHEHQKQWKWFIDLIRQDMSVLNTALLIGVVVAVLNLATAVFAQVLIDTLIPSHDLMRIYFAIALVVLLLITKSLINYGRQLLLLKQGLDINIRITGSFLSNLLYLPFPFFATRKTGDMVARLNYIRHIQQTVSYLFGELLISMLVLLVSLLAVFLYNVKLGLILSAGIPFYALIAYRYHKPVLSGQRELLGAHAMNESNYIGTINNIIPVKSFGREGFFAKTGLEVFGVFQQKSYQLGRYGMIIQLFTGIAGILITMAIIAWSSVKMLDNSMSTGVFLAVFSLSGTVLASLGTVAFANIQIQGARIAFERMYEFSGMEKEFYPLKEASEHKQESFEKIELQNISFRYPGRRLLLEDISFSLQKGEMVTIFGDNGCGKSTLLSLVQRFYMPDEGNVLLNNRNVHNFSLPVWRRMMAVVPQDISLINASLLANIVMSSEKSEAEQAVKLLSDYGFDPLVERFPQGYLTMLGDGGIRISGGQKQLVGLARALVQIPELLLLDELTAHMDRQTENFVLDLLDRLRKDMGILNITHNIRNAALSDKIIVLQDRHMVATGKHHELMDFENPYSEVWQSFLSSTGS